MLHNKYARAKTLFYFFYISKNLTHQFGSKPERRLIQKEEFWSAHKGPSQSQNLLLASGQAKRIGSFFFFKNRKLKIYFFKTAPDFFFIL